MSLPPLPSDLYRAPAQRLQSWNDSSDSRESTCSLSSHGDSWHPFQLHVHSHIRVVHAAQEDYRAVKPCTRIYQPEVGNASSASSTGSTTAPRWSKGTSSACCFPVVMQHPRMEEDTTDTTDALAMAAAGRSRKLTSTLSTLSRRHHKGSVAPAYLPLKRMKRRTLSMQAPPGPWVIICGLRVPQSALTDKAGSVTLTILVYTLYTSAVVLLLSYAVWWDKKNRTGDWIMGVWTPTTPWSPTMLNTFAGFSVACAVLWPMAGYLCCAAPSGIPALFYLQIMVLHRSHFGLVCKAIMVATAVASGGLAVGVLWADPFSSWMLTYCGSVAVMAFAILALAPLAVLTEFPLSWEPLDRRWRVHMRRALKSTFTVVLFLDPYLAYPTLRWCLRVEPFLLYPLGVSIFLRIVFAAYMLGWVPMDEVVSWDVENFVAASLPAWGISGMAFACTGPWNNAAAPDAACSADAWLVHGIVIALGLFITAFLILLANDLTTVSVLSMQEQSAVAEQTGVDPETVLSSLMDPNSSNSVQHHSSSVPHGQAAP